MVGIEEAYCNTLIRALLLANYQLLESTITDALQPTGHFGKGDTLGLDAIPEIAVLQCLKSFDQYAVLLTEEVGEEKNALAQAGPEDERGSRTFFICDPTDRSSQLKDYLEQSRSDAEPTRKITDVLRRDGTRAEWDSRYGTPSSITGAFSAITCVRRGLPICTALLNYITQEIFVACNAGVYRMDLPAHDDIASWQTIDFRAIQSHGKAIHFRQTGPALGRRFVTFLGRDIYEQNLLDSRLVRSKDDMEREIHHREPGGPSRILYLSDLQPEDNPIGFIVANGEKIGEWIHWFTFCRFAISPNDPRRSALAIYEVREDRPWTRDGILMSPSPPYSILKVADGVHRGACIDIHRLETFPDPSRYRGMLLVTLSNNPYAVSLARQHGHRAIEFFDT